MKYTTIDSCRLCQGAIEDVLAFGETSLANSYPQTQGESEEKYPLTLAKCKDCGHVQLKETVNPEVLFDNYLYASSDSPALVEHFGKFALRVCENLDLCEETSVLEIGCNDGVLLKQFKALGMQEVYGFEPAKNICEKTAGTGLAVFNEYFQEETAARFGRVYGRMDVICANNVFAHIANIDSVVKGILNLLKDDGVFVFENAYLLDTIQGFYFDQVYHEHLQYYGIKPLVKYLGKFGLEIFKVEYSNIQGGSFRIYVKRQTCTKFQADESLKLALYKEENFNLYSNETFARFQKLVKEKSSALLWFVESVRAKGKTISCYGCPAKFALLSKMFGLNASNIEYVVDDSPLKQGRFSSGSGIPIVGRQHFIEKPTDFCIISAWNMSQGIRQRNTQYTGRFIIPLPEFTLC